jgi:hypothetical protein
MLENFSFHLNNDAMMKGIEIYALELAEPELLDRARRKLLLRSVIKENQRSLGN